MVDPIDQLNASGYIENVPAVKWINKKPARWVWKPNHEVPGKTHALERKAYRQLRAELALK